MTNNKQQTAVEWLVKEYHLPPNSPLVQQAKEMEKEQHLNTWCNSMNRISFNKYYNETYGGGEQ
jgi:hypothetical protein